MAVLWFLCAAEFRVEKGLIRVRLEAGDRCAAHKDPKMVSAVTPYGSSAGV
jgi:hypothetical protein